MDINVQELKEKLDQEEDFLFIDVREDYEYEEFNLGAKLIPLGDLMHAVDELEDHLDGEIVVHCRSGKRSALAQQILEQHGFSNVRNLEGGILAWIEKFGNQSS